MESPAGLSGASAPRVALPEEGAALASAVLAAVVVVSLVFAFFFLGPFSVALSAATESVLSVTNALVPNTVEARKIARDRRAIFFFVSRDLLSNDKKFRFLQFTPIISGRWSRSV
jgi:hypothetical protein